MARPPTARTRRGKWTHPRSARPRRLTRQARPRADRDRVREAPPRSRNRVLRLDWSSSVLAPNGAARERRRRAGGRGNPWSGCSAAEIEAAALAQLGGAKNKALSNAKEL